MTHHDIPSFFDPKNAELWDYRLDDKTVRAEAQKWRARGNLAPATDASKQVYLLIIDAQKDFCLPQGALYVGGRSGRGSVDDSSRIAQFMYANAGHISKIIPSFDSHDKPPKAFHIFSPPFWETSSGGAVAPHTDMTVEDLVSGRYRVTDAALSALGVTREWLTAYVCHYAKVLKENGRQPLHIWPYHCIVGTEGHQLMGVIEEAMMFLSLLHQVSICPVYKGQEMLFESYSIFGGEVLTTHHGKVLGQKDTRRMRECLAAYRLIIVGEAASHCVKATIEDLIKETRGNRALADKIYVVEDCMSAVTVPDGHGGFYADYTQEVRETFKYFASLGIHVVKSTDPIESWPSF
jgi:nicotinamidase-related amidase